MEPKRKKISSIRSTPAGEVFIWLNAMGLAVGLIMISGILLLVVYQGIISFWPKDVLELHVEPSSVGSLPNSRVVSGEIAKKQNKKVRRTPSQGDDPDIEWQLFVGNKDVFGFSFVYVDYNSITKVAKPADIIVLERQEYGRAIGYAIALNKGNVRVVEAGAREFDQTLNDKLRQTEERRREINRIERVEIGRVNAAMESIRLKLKRAASDGKLDLSEESGDIQILRETSAELTVEYGVLEQRARELRAQQDEFQLRYRLSSGEERDISVGEIIDYTYPNRLGPLQKIGLLFQRSYRFAVEYPREANTEGGIYPAIFGTFVMTLIMSLIVTPFGVMAAIYLSEYAKNGLFVRLVRIAVNNLAGVPSIVFGVFGLGFFVYFVGGNIDQIFFSDRLPTPTFGTGGVLWASLTLALLTVPVVVVATEEGLAAVSRGMREAGLACGASKWQCIQRIVLPAAAPGILTGIILAVARGAGEVAPLMLVGVVKSAPTLPINATFPYLHFEQKFMHLGFHIYDLGFQSPDSEAAKPVVFATTFLLIMLVIGLNLIAIYLREKLRGKLEATH